jgi:hypothetical protein
VSRITGMAFGWIGSTTAFGDVVRKPYWPPGFRLSSVCHGVVIEELWGVGLPLPGAAHCLSGNT